MKDNLKDERQKEITDSFKSQLISILKKIPQLDQIVKENQIRGFVKDCLECDVMNPHNNNISVFEGKKEIEYEYLIMRMNVNDKEKITMLVKEVKERLIKLWTNDL